MSEIVADIDLPDFPCSTRDQRASKRDQVIGEILAYGIAHPDLARRESGRVHVPEAGRRIAIEQAIARGLSPSRVMAEVGCDYEQYRAVADLLADTG